MTINAFKPELLSFICPLQNIIFSIFDPEGFKLHTRLCLGFTHLNEHRLRHNFHQYLNPLCTCSLELENTFHFLLHCHHNTLFRAELTNTVKTFVVDFASLSDSKKVKTTLYGDSKWDDNQSNFILSASINYIKIIKINLI